MISMNELIPVDEINEENRARSRAINLRVACPGIITAFDPDEQTVTVQLALREKRRDGDGNEQWVDIPQLVDVPLVLPRGGGYVLTLPVQAGDECLVVFGDACMDAWWQSGGVQNQIDCRRHDLSDGFAVLGVWSQPQRVPQYSTTAAELRSLDGGAGISISGSTITIRASNVNITGTTTIEGRSFLQHTHTGVESGGDKTGGVD